MKRRRGSIVDVVCTAYLSVLFVGYIPVLPGTLASLLTVPVVLGMEQANVLPPDLTGIILALLAAFVLLTGVLCIIADRGIPTKHVDQSIIVLDEALGMFIALTPIFFMPYTWLTVVIAFLAFRFFDIVKPSIIGRTDAIESPLNVMLDDVLAGAYAALVVVLAQLLTFLL